MFKESKKRNWQLTPEEADELPPAPGREEMHNAGQRAEGREFEAAGRVAAHEDNRFAEPETLHLFWKPPIYTIGAGVPGVFLLAVFYWLPELDAAMGHPLGDYLIGGQVLVLLVSILLLFAAAPVSKPKDWTPEKQKEIDKSKRYFRKKRRL